MKKIMNRAWEIYRTLEGDHAAKLAMALREAWVEAKAENSKQQFNGMANVQYRTYANGEADDDCYLTFKGWDKAGMSRIYINDYKRRTLGFIDRHTGTVEIKDNQGISTALINAALDTFNATYNYAV